MKFDNIKVWGFEGALRGMRNAKNSWDKADSGYKCSKDDSICKDCYFASCFGPTNDYVIGPNDMKLCKSLIIGGSEHRKFMRQIFVSVDITAPMYFWSEFDTYKVGTVANSTSKMHTIEKAPITLENFEIDDFDFNFDELIPDDLIPKLEKLRQKYLETKDKRYWKELIRWLPESWLQTRTVTMNYENVYTIVSQRENHKLNEWSGKDNPELINFINDFAKKLPYAEEFIFSCQKEKKLERQKIRLFDKLVKKIDEMEDDDDQELIDIIVDILKDYTLIKNSI